MARQTLEEYLAMEYPFQVIADPDGGYVVMFPDLPGCMTQADTLDELPEMAEGARRSWMSAVYEDGEDIPLPSYPEEYSGKFVARLPRSLHRRLAEEAERQGVSLNQHVVALLSRGDTESRIERRLDALEARLLSRADDAAADLDAEPSAPEAATSASPEASRARAGSGRRAGGAAPGSTRRSGTPRASPAGAS